MTDDTVRLVCQAARLRQSNRRLRLLIAGGIVARLLVLAVQWGVGL